MFDNLNLFEQQNLEALGYVSIFYMFSVLIGAILREVQKKIHLENRITVIFVGIFVAYYHEHFGFLGRAVNYTYSSANLDLLFIVFCPVMVFLGNYSCDVYHFKKEFKNGLILAYPSLFLQIGLMALSFKFLIGYENEFSFLDILYLMAMLCPNSPGILADKLQSMGMSSKFLSIFYIEKQYGPVIGLFLCATIRRIILGTSEDSFNIFLFARNMTLTVSVSFISGLTFGIISSYWMRSIPRDTLGLNIVLFTCYSLLAYFAFNSVFFFGGISVGLSVQALGLFMSHYGKLHIKKESLASIMKLQLFLEENMNNMMSMFMGSIIAIFMRSQNKIQFGDLTNLFILYLINFPIRALSILPFYKTMQNSGYGFSLKKLLILILANEKSSIWLVVYFVTPNKEDYQYTLFFGCFFNTLSMIGNSFLSSDFIMKKFKLKKPKICDLNNKAIIYKIIQDNNKEYTENLKINPIFQLADWDKVDSVTQFLTLDQISMKVQKMDKNKLLHQTRYDVLVKIKSNLSGTLNDQRASINAYRTIEHACNICLDNLDQPINVWEIIRTEFQSLDNLQYLFKLRNVPVLGKIIKQQINKYISSVYEICICAATAMIETGLNVQHSPHFDYQRLKDAVNPKIHKEVKITVFQEIIQEKRKIDEYIQELYYSFNYILKSVQTRLSTQILISFCFQEIKTLFKQRVLSEQEYGKCVQYFQQKLDNLNVIKYNIDLPDIQFLGVAFPIIQHLDDNEIHIFRQNSFQKDFKAGEFLYKQNYKSDYCYIIISGQIEERVHERVIQSKSIGNFIGQLNMLNNQICMTSAVATKDTKCQVFHIKQVQKLFKINKKFKKKIYRKALFLLIQTHKKESLILKNLSESDINFITKKGFLTKVQQGKTINIKHGAYILYGSILDRTGLQYLKYYYIPPSKFIQQFSNYKAQNQLLLQQNQARFSKKISMISKTRSDNIIIEESIDGSFVNTENYDQIFYADEKTLLFIFNEFNYDILFKNDKQDRFSVMVQQYQNQKKQNSKDSMISMEEDIKNEQYLLQPGHQFHSSRSSYASYERSSICINIDNQIENITYNNGNIKTSEDYKIDQYFQIVGGYDQ